MVSLNLQGINNRWGALDTDKDILNWAVSIVAAANSGSEQKVFETGKLKKNRRIKANASTSKNGGDSGPDGMSLKIMREQNQMHLDDHCHCQHILMHMLEYAQILCLSLSLSLGHSVTHTPTYTRQEGDIAKYCQWVFLN